MSNEISDIIGALTLELAELRKIPAGRKIAIAITQLETAILFLKSHQEE